MPSFLHGSYEEVLRAALVEGRRCGAQYLEAGSLPVPPTKQELQLGEVVVAHEVVDFNREQPAWRLHLVSQMVEGMYEALGWQTPIPARDAFESILRETAWGALYFLLHPSAPQSAERTAHRLHAVLRCWEPLQSVRYLFKKPGESQTLDELMGLACDWILDAWCPGEGGSVRARLSVAAEQMAQAAREDSIAVIVRQWPRVLSFARELKHPASLADPEALRQHLLTLDVASFARVSGACTPALLECLYDWDYDLGLP